MTEQMLYGALLTLLSGVIWYWVRGVDERGKENKRAIEDVKERYQRRDDAGKDYQSLYHLMQDVRAQVEKINDKLDRKADKS